MIDPDVEPAWTVPGFAPPEECEHWIARAEAAGPELATVNLADGVRVDESLRNNTRVILDDQEAADALFGRVRQHVPESLHEGAWRVSGVNERFRIYRYEPGQRFRLHHDGCFARSDRQRSFLTFMIYLSTPERGGATSFPTLDLEVAARRGDALFFQHLLAHEGCEVLAGRKYVLRSDVMYRR